MNTLKIPKGVKTIAVTCLQWGDTGKGKIVDLLADWADIIVRGTGGANAGHSICFGESRFVFHLVPSGILHDEKGKINIIGSGTAIDPRTLCEELALFRKQGLSYGHLMLALNAKLTLPTQIVRDRVGEGEAGERKIGTTGRGIGPTYADHVMRVGLIVNDLLNPDILAKKVSANVAFSSRALAGCDPQTVRAVLHQPFLGNGIFYHPERIFNTDEIVQSCLECGKTLGQFIGDTDAYVHDSVGSKKILLEGAQGALLDVDHGTRPFVTSSSCTVDGLAKGAGLNRSHVDLALGIIKGFYETRVGEGPFPTELGGEDSARWCRQITKEKEMDEYSGASVNAPHEFIQGIALRMAGDEYGATTKRPRRIGWLDLPLLRYALQWASPDVVLTKLDVLNQFDEIKVCTHYKYVGPYYRYGAEDLHSGRVLDTAIPLAEVLEYCRPVYHVFPGWKKSFKGVTSFEGLPCELRHILDFVICQTGISPRIISGGSDREDTIFV